MQKRKHWLVSLLLILFTGYYGGITLFPHVHEVGGQRIVHSHPYSGQASHPGHQHSPSQLQLIQLLSLLILLTLLSGQLGAPVRSFRRMECALLIAFTGFRYTRSRLLRGPPAI